jgi:hypothetical protein
MLRSPFFDEKDLKDYKRNNHPKNEVAFGGNGLKKDRLKFPNSLFDFFPWYASNSYSYYNSIENKSNYSTSFPEFNYIQKLISRIKLGDVNKINSIHSYTFKNLVACMINIVLFFLLFIVFIRIRLYVLLH